MVNKLKGSVRGGKGYIEILSCGKWEQWEQDGMKDGNI